MRALSGWSNVGLTAAALALWVGLLSRMVEPPPMAGLALLLAEAVALLGLVRSLAPEAERRTVAMLYLGGLLLYSLQTLVIQSCPQWADHFSDSAGYDLGARALLLHGQGEPVPAAAFRLKGLVRAGIDYWPPGDAYRFADVFGMSRALYLLYLAGIYAVTEGSRATAVLGNLPFLAGMAGGVFLLARELSGQRRVALLAAGLVLLDPNFAVWGSVLLRDALIACLCVLALLGGVRLARRGVQTGPLGLVLGALAALAALRFNAVAAFAAAGALAALPRWQHVPQRKTLMALAGLGLAAVLAVALLPGPRAAWEASPPGRILHENIQILLGGARVLEAASGQGRAEDDARINAVRRDWHARLREQPLWLNLARSGARTLLGPYPWVALTQGLAGDNFYELMYPGMALWLLLLPGFFYAWWWLPVRRDPAVALCLTWLLLETAVYVIGYGEFSGRERIMAQPLLWIFAAWGAWELWARRRQA
jgi:4-amino-4-deoxy-L-arabinose transferase-like glycosyltransferase